MRRAWLVMLLVAGCGADGGGDDFPITPGGGGGVGTARDAGVDAPGDGASTLTGRVCLTRDLRELASCAATGADGLTVTIGGETATTAADGVFAIAAPAAADVWRVTGGAIVPSVMAPVPLATTHVIPAIAAADYADLITANLVALQAGQGSVVARVVRGAAALPGATVASTPLADNPTFYDGASAATWETTATGARGVAWLPGIPVGAATLAVTPEGGATTDVATTVEDQAITFVTISVP